MIKKWKYRILGVGWYDLWSLRFPWYKDRRWDCWTEYSSSKPFSSTAPDKLYKASR